MISSVDFDISIAHSFTHERYELLAPLGVGGMGEVYKAIDLGLDRQIVALKFLFPHLLHNEHSRLQFQREVIITRKLSHPNIVRTFGFEHSAPHCSFIAMEYVDGTPLDSLLHSEEFSITERELLLIQIAQGVAYAHRRGIVHRDLKPANVLISWRNEAKIVDFGVASVLRTDSEIEPTGRVIGTPLYMAPEQFSTQAGTTASDVYSFGILMFETLCSRLPFIGRTVYEVALQHATEQPMFPSDLSIPSMWKEIIHACLEKDPANRPRDMAEVCDIFALHYEFEPNDETLEGKIEENAEARNNTHYTHLESDAVLPSRYVLTFLLLLSLSMFVGEFLLDIAGLAVLGIILFLPVINIRFLPTARQRLSITLFCVLSFGFGAARYQHEGRRITIQLTLLAERHLGVSLPWVISYAQARGLVESPDNVAKAISTPRRKFALKALQNIGYDFNQLTSSGISITHHALSSGELHYAQFIFESPTININKRNKMQETLLHAAVYTDFPPIVAQIIVMGADPNLASVSGETPLSSAVARNSLESVKLLLRWQANPNTQIITRRKGMISALHYAAWRQHDSIVQELLDAKVDINSRDHQGSTPLHEALMANPRGRYHRSIIERLLRAGADPGIKNNLGKDSFTLAQEVGSLLLLRPHEIPAKNK